MTAIVTTTVRTDAEIRDKLNSEVYDAIEFVASVAKDTRRGMGGEVDAKSEHRRFRACELLLNAWGKAVSMVKLPDAPPVTPEQGLQQARGALVAMPAELAGVVREPAVREAIRKAWEMP